MEQAFGSVLGMHGNIVREQCNILTGKVHGDQILQPFNCNEHDIFAQSQLQYEQPHENGLFCFADSNLTADLFPTNFSDPFNTYQPTVSPHSIELNSPYLFTNTPIAGASVYNSDFSSAINNNIHDSIYNSYGVLFDGDVSLVQKNFLFDDNVNKFNTLRCPTNKQVQLPSVTSYPFNFIPLQPDTAGIGSLGDMNSQADSYSSERLLLFDVNGNPIANYMEEIDESIPESVKVASRSRHDHNGLAEKMEHVSYRGPEIERIDMSIEFPSPIQDGLAIPSRGFFVSQMNNCDQPAQRLQTTRAIRNDYGRDYTEPNFKPIFLQHTSQQEDNDGYLHSDERNLATTNSVEMLEYFPMDLYTTTEVPKSLDQYMQLHFSGQYSPEQDTHDGNNTQCQVPAYPINIEGESLISQSPAQLKTRLPVELSALLLGIPWENASHLVQFRGELKDIRSYDDRTINSNSGSSMTMKDAVDSPSTATLQNMDVMSDRSVQGEDVVLPPYNNYVTGLEQGSDRTFSIDEGTSTSQRKILANYRFDLVALSMDNLGELQGQFAIQKTLTAENLVSLPPPPGFCHSQIVLTDSAQQTSSDVANAWEVAQEAEDEKEVKIANASTGAPTEIKTVPSRLNFMTKKSNAEKAYARKKSGIDRAQLKLSIRGSLPSNAESLGGRDVTRSKWSAKRSEEQKMETAAIKKIGVCLRCKIQKEACSSGTPCNRCIEVHRSKRTLYATPCWRSKLNEVELYRRRTQHGLFIYTYTNQQDALSIRAVRILDHLLLEKPNESPITFQEEFSIEADLSFRYISCHLVSDDMPDKQFRSRGEELSRGVIDRYLNSHIKTVIQALGSSHRVIKATLKVAGIYCRRKQCALLRQSLRLFTARFLRRKYWISINERTGESYHVAWMDVPWRALPTNPPKSRAEAEVLNDILKKYLSGTESLILKSFKNKIYTRDREDWFEIFLVTFIFQVVLSENLEMSFYSKVPGSDIEYELPWSTFGGLRSYSSREIAAHFRAINGTIPFRLTPEERSKLGHLGSIENKYIEEYQKLLKESRETQIDLGSRRSQSAGHGNSPGNWWQWALETVSADGIAEVTESN